MSNDTNNTFYLDTPNNSPRPASVEDFPTLGSILESQNLSMDQVAIRITNAGQARENIEMTTSILPGDNVMIALSSNKSGK
jgi:hypothetical protein